MRDAYQCSLISGLWGEKAFNHGDKSISRRRLKSCLSSIVILLLTKL